MNFWVYFVINIFYSLTLVSGTLDENGYIVYCPCMGRFGNQGEQLLGTLHFAKSLNRTLVLPPFIEYNKYEVDFPPFDRYFNVELLQKYTNVILMDSFLKNVAPLIWLPDERVIYCYSARDTSVNQKRSCDPFKGNPFKPFWNHIGVTYFKDSEFYSPLETRVSNADKWKKRYGDKKVLTFVGAPSSFPANYESLKIAEYLELSSKIRNEANSYRELRGFARQPYLAVHLRHGSDWLRACEMLKPREMSVLFSSRQCTEGVINSDLSLPFELCLHPVEIISENIKNALSDTSNIHTISNVYIATDNDNHTLWTRLKSELPGVTLITPTATYYNGIVKKKFNAPHFMVDIYLLTYSNVFIGNCISSFSAFASRLRVHNLQFIKGTTFFAEELLHEDLLHVKDEL